MGEQVGERRRAPGVRKNLGRSGVEVSKKGEGWAEMESPTVNLKHFTEFCSPTNGEQ